MKAPTKRQRRKIVGLLLMVSFLLMISLAAVNFALSLKAMVDKRTTYMLADAVQEYSRTFSAGVNAKLNAVATISDILGAVDRNDAGQMDEIIGRATKREDFYSVAISDIDGNTRTNEGSALNVSAQDYFLQAMQGEAVITNTTKSPVDMARALLLSVPIYNQTGTVSGVLTCGYELSHLEQLIQRPRYFGEAYGMVFSGDYEVVSWERHSNALPTGGDTANILKSLENGEMMGGMTVQQLQNNMENRMSGSFTVDYHGERRLISYTPLDISDWYAFCFAPLTVYNQETADVNRIVALLILELLLALGMLFYYIMRSNRRHSKMIKESNQKYEVIIGNICGGVEVTTMARSLEEMEAVYVSAGFTEMTGYTLEDIMSMWQGRIYHIISKKDRATVNEELARLVEDKKGYDMEYRIVCRDGHLVWVMDRGRVIESADGVRQRHSVLTDISVIKEQKEKLAISEERFRIAIESADSIMFDYDSVNNVYKDFANSERMLGKTLEQINDDLAYTRDMDELTRTVEITKYFYHPDDFDTIMEQSRIGVEVGEVYFDARVRIDEGKYIWCRIHLNIINDPDGTQYRVLGFMGNIDMVKRQSELFRVRSEKDALTGFYNKAATVSLVSDALNSESDVPHTMFVMDIDNFKTINDTMGHIAGDAVIAEAAERIRAIFRSDDILGRVGGDEFVVLIRGVSETDRIIRKAIEITEAFETMSINAGGYFNVSISIGIEVCTGQSNYEESFIRADKALYRAKRSGKNRYVFYDESLSGLNCHTYNDGGGVQDR